MSSVIPATDGTTTFSAGLLGGIIGGGLALVITIVIVIMLIRRSKRIRQISKKQNEIPQKISHGENALDKVIPKSIIKMSPNNKNNEISLEIEKKKEDYSNMSPAINSPAPSNNNASNIINNTGEDSSKINVNLRSLITRTKRGQSTTSAQYSSPRKSNNSVNNTSKKSIINLKDVNQDDYNNISKSDLKSIESDTMEKSMILLEKLKKGRKNENEFNYELNNEFKLELMEDKSETSRANDITTLDKSSRKLLDDSEIVMRLNENETIDHIEVSYEKSIKVKNNKGNIVNIEPRKSSYNNTATLYSPPIKSTNPNKVLTLFTEGLKRIPQEEKPINIKDEIEQIYWRKKYPMDLNVGYIDTEVSGVSAHRVVLKHSHNTIVMYTDEDREQPNESFYNQKFEDILEEQIQMDRDEIEAKIKEKQVEEKLRNKLYRIKEEEVYEDSSNEEEEVEAFKNENENNKNFILENYNQEETESPSKKILQVNDHALMTDFSQPKNIEIIKETKNDIFNKKTYTYEESFQKKIKK